MRVSKVHKIKVVAPTPRQSQPDTYYTPIIIQDQFANKYMAISYYEARVIVELLDKVKVDDPSGTHHYNTGDWFEDLPTKIRKVWDI